MFRGGAGPGRRHSERCLCLRRMDTGMDHLLPTTVAVQAQFPRRWRSARRC